MKPQDIENKIQEVMSSFVNFAVPQHRHTGVDSLQIYMGDLLLDSRGLIFPFSNGNIIFNTDALGLGVTTSNPNFDFTIGSVTNGSPTFGSINFNANSAVGAVVLDATIPDSVNEFTIFGNRTDLEITDGVGITMGAEFNVNGLFFSTTGISQPFTLQLPETIQPPAVAGGIYFDGANFRGCVDGVNWLTFTLT